MKSLNMMTDIWQISGETPIRNDLMYFMKQDKKVRDGSLRFIIPNSIGSTFVADGVDLALVREIIDISSEKS
jgi:3-dehydroquinate synthetase